MCGNKMGNTGAMHFASMLQTNAALQELDMSQCDLVKLLEGGGDDVISGRFC